MKKVIDGFKFGMIPQLIIGPICLLVFHTAENNGFLFTIPLILVVAFVDILYVTFVLLGVQKLLADKKRKTKIFLQVIGAVLLIIFGMSTILSVFNINIIPGTSLHPNTKNIMLKGFLIGITNPIIIVFWGSILTTKFIENKFNKKEQLFYCIGIVLSTLTFQTFVALLGSTVAQLIPPKIKMILNITIGIYLITFGFQRLKNKPIKTRRKKK